MAKEIRRMIWKGCICFQNRDSIFNLKTHWQLDDMGWFRFVGFWARGGSAPMLPRAIRVGPLADEGNENGGGSSGSLSSLII